MRKLLTLLLITIMIPNIGSALDTQPDMVQMVDGSVEVDINGNEPMKVDLVKLRHRENGYIYGDITLKTNVSLIFANAEYSTQLQYRTHNYSNHVSLDAELRTLRNNTYYRFVNRVHMAEDVSYLYLSFIIIPGVNQDSHIELEYNFRVYLSAPLTLDPHQDYTGDIVALPDMQYFGYSMIGHTYEYNFLIIPLLEVDDNITETYRLSVRLVFSVIIEGILSDAELSFDGHRVVIDGRESYQVYLYNISSGIVKFDISHYGQALTLDITKVEVIIPRLVGDFEYIEVSPLMQGIGIMIVISMVLLSYKVVSVYGAKKVQMAIDSKV